MSRYRVIPIERLLLVRSESSAAEKDAHPMIWPDHEPYETRSAFQDPDPGLLGQHNKGTSRTLGGMEPGLFSDGKRILVVKHSEAVAQAQSAREEGFLPVIVCASKHDREALGEAFSEQTYEPHFLVRGYDDDQIEWLLHHPSRETLQALASGDQLIYPNEASQQALAAWLRRDGLAAEVVRRLVDKEVRLEDFTLIDEESTEHDYRCVLQWSFDPRHHLFLAVAPLEGQSRLSHIRDDEGVATTLIWRGGFVKFDDRGNAKPEFALLRYMADAFDLERDMIDALNPERPLAAVWSKVTDWMSRQSDAWGELLSPQNWDLIGDAWRTQQAQPRFAPPVSGLRHGGADRGNEPTKRTHASPETPIETPLLQLLQSAPELVFKVNWRATQSAKPILPTTQPAVILYMGEQHTPARSSWSQDLSKLHIGGVELPLEHGYQWRWVAALNQLEVRIDSLP